MANQTTFPTRPQKKSQPEQQIWTVWSMLQYFANSVYDNFVNTVNSFIGKFATGTATVANTNTTVNVIHNLGTTNYVVELTPLQNPGGAFWVTGKTASQFTINLAVAAGVGGQAFDWIVKAV